MLNPRKKIDNDLRNKHHGTLYKIIIFESPRL